jgi:hypothetical protein
MQGIKSSRSIQKISALSGKLRKHYGDLASLPLFGAISVLVANKVEPCGLRGRRSGSDNYEKQLSRHIYKPQKNETHAYIVKILYQVSSSFTGALAQSGNGEEGWLL